MSNIRLQGNPSGTGTLTIASPNTNSDFTLNLPASNGTLLDSSGSTTLTNLTVTNGASIQGLTVGRGAGAVSTNTAVGVSALQANTTGGRNTALGNESLFSNTTGNNNLAVGGRDDAAWTPLYSNTTGSNNVAVGNAALSRNTTASNNTAVGYQAGYSNTTGTALTAFGANALRSSVSVNNNVALGDNAGYAATGAKGTFIGSGSGSEITSGAANTILGRYTGNQGGLDIRTASNYAVISDGDGNPLISTSQGRSVALEGAVPQTGEGITFPATQVASSNPNTLDDYEEGAWTPNSPTSGYVLSEAVAVYTKVGRLVTVQFAVMFSSVGSNNSSVVFGGLPFAAAAVTGGSSQAGVCRENSTSGAIYVVNVQSVNTTSVEINSMDGVNSGSQRTIRTSERYCGTLSYITS